LRLTLPTGEALLRKRSVRGFAKAERLATT
jgi:hypothetical protein